MSTTISGTLPPSIRVEDNDTLSELAAQNNMSLADLLKLNPQFDASKVDGKVDTARNGNSGWDPDFIRPGDTIILRKEAAADTGTNPATQTDPASVTNPTGAVKPVSFNPSDTAASPTTTEARKNEAMRYFQSQGWSRAQAAGIVANLEAESGFRPGVEGDEGKAYGIGQWHPDRQADFKAAFGKDIQGSSFGEQLKFVQYELTHEKANAGNALKNTNSPTEAAAVFCRLFEIPADIPGQSQYRGTLAQNIFNTSDSKTMNA